MSAILSVSSAGDYTGRVSVSALPAPAPRLLVEHVVSRAGGRNGVDASDDDPLDELVRRVPPIEFGNRLGDLTFGHPVWDSGDVPDEVYELDSADNGFADVWHTDMTFMPRPPMGSILRPVVLPRNGGDTNWADAELAYLSLSEPIRRLVDGLTAVHDAVASSATTSNSAATGAETPGTARKSPNSYR